MKTIYADIPCTESGARSLVALLLELLPECETEEGRGLYLLEKLRRDVEAEIEAIEKHREAEAVLAARDHRPTIKDMRE